VPACILRHLRHEVHYHSGADDSPGSALTPGTPDGERVIGGAGCLSLAACDVAEGSSASAQAGGATTQSSQHLTNSITVPWPGAAPLRRWVTEPVNRPSRSGPAVTVGTPAV